MYGNDIYNHFVSGPLNAFVTKFSLFFTSRTSRKIREIFFRYSTTICQKSNVYRLYFDHILHFLRNFVCTNAKQFLVNASYILLLTIFINFLLLDFNPNIYMSNFSTNCEFCALKYIFFFF